MNNLIIRRARADEINWINGIYTEINFMPSDFDNEIIFIVDFEHEKVGLGRLTWVGGELELGGIYVDAQHRKKGIARALVTRLDEEARSLNRPTWCIPFLHLIEFYQSFGYEPIASGTPLPDLILKKVTLCNGLPDGAVSVLKKEMN